MAKGYFCTLYFPYAWFFRPLCVGAGRTFSSHQPLSNNIQQCNEGKLWIRCYVNHNMHRLHQCYKLFLWSQQNICLFFSPSLSPSLSRSLFLTQSRISVLGWKQLSLHSREQHPLPSAKFGLNSIAYPHSSVSNPNACPMKKQNKKKSPWPWSGEYV